MIRTLWDFSRPHTIIGSTLAVVVFYLIAARDAGRHDLFLLLVSYGAALAVNLYIVGLNQLTDVAIDRVNKPHLPLPSGRLSAHDAARIVAVAAVLGLGLAAAGGPWLFFTIGTVFVVGSCYSLPPLRLKRKPGWAALSIVLSRGVIGNVGLWLTFTVGLSGVARLPAHVLAFVAFMVGFMTVIALLKDVPDIEGDRIHEIRTFSVRFGPKRVLASSVGILGVAYAGMASLGAFGVEGLDPPVTALTHLALLAVLLRFARQAQPESKASMTRFYRQVWTLYYLEFGAYLFACLGTGRWI